MKDNLFDVIIIGGSYAGLSAAMSLGRALRSVLVLDNNQPCNKQTPHSHNFVTQDGETPAVIREKVLAQVRAYPSVRFETTTVTGLNREGHQFIVSAGAATWTARKILLATGVQNTLPPIPGMEACWGVSVLHCPYCHGYEVRNEVTAIIASGADAFHMAKLIRNWTDQLTVCSNGPSGFSKEEQALLQAKQIKTDERPIREIVHEHGYVQQVIFEDGGSLPLKAIYARPPFHLHSAALYQSLGCDRNEMGLITVDEMKQTSVEGVFAAGDNITPMRSLANAVAAGTSAGAFINHKLIEEDL